MNEIKIAKPQIVYDGEIARLEALVSGDSINKIHYFEVQKEYGKYLCDERSDAFVLSLLYYAIVNGYSIRCEAPLSEQLYHQLTRTLLPTMAKYYPKRFHNIAIYAPLDHEPIKNAGGVGGAVSGGVDSFYTIISNLETDTSDFDITHLLIANSFNMYRGDKDTRQRFEEIAKKAEEISSEMKIPLIRMYTNHSEYWYPHYQNIFCAKYASYPYALQKLFSTYHFSSGYEYKDFSLTTEDWDSSHYDAVSAPNLSSENLNFLLSGGGVSRVEKIRRIADNKVVQRHLQVCNLQQDNCSICSKCMRTQFSLYAIKKLDAFDASFQLDKFYEYKNMYLTKMLYKKGPFDIDNLKYMQENNIDIPIAVKIKGGFIRPIYVIKEAIIKLPFLHTLYKKCRNHGKTNELDIIERYNIDKDFAKQCDKEII